jgi:carnitine O-palmitoyltransferase 1, liver isoform
MAGVASFSFSSWFINENDTENQNLLDVIWESGLRSWKKRFARFRSKVRNGVYPAHLESLWVIMGLIMSLHYSSVKLPYDSVNKLVDIMPR